MNWIICCGCVTTLCCGGGSSFPTDADIDKMKFEEKGTTALNGRIRSDKDHNVGLIMAKKEKSGHGLKLRFSVGIGFPLGVPAG